MDSCMDEQNRATGGWNGDENTNSLEYYLQKNNSTTVWMFVELGSGYNCI